MIWVSLFVKRLRSSTLSVAVSRTRLSDEYVEILIVGHIQFDDPTFCYFCSENMISGMEQAGVDHEELLDTYIRAINVCVKGHPKGLRVSVHMCRGNFTVSRKVPGEKWFLNIDFVRVEYIFAKGVTGALQRSCSLNWTWTNSMCVFLFHKYFTFLKLRPEYSSNMTQSVPVVSSH
jgi:hypothetical protein